MNQINPSTSTEQKDILATELCKFEEIKDLLLKTDKGRYALIHGKEFAGCWDTIIDATQVGYEKFGNVPFLVKQVSEIELALDFNSLSLPDRKSVA